MKTEKMPTAAEVQAVVDGLKQFNTQGLAAIVRLGALADDLAIRVADLEAFKRMLQAHGEAATGI
jgi:hypothetical protein